MYHIRKPRAASTHGDKGLERLERRQKRGMIETSCIKKRVEEGNGSVPDGRDGREKGQPLRELALWAREDKAQSRVVWKRQGRGDDNFGVSSAKWDLKSEQQRRKREGSRERREQIRESTGRGERRAQGEGRSEKTEDRREKREERGEKRKGRRDPQKGGQRSPKEAF